MTIVTTTPQDSECPNDHQGHTLHVRLADRGTQRQSLAICETVRGRVISFSFVHWRLAYCSTLQSCYDDVKTG